MCNKDKRMLKKTVGNYKDIDTDTMKFFYT